MYYSLNRAAAIVSNIALIILICYSLSLVFWRLYAPNVGLDDRLVNPAISTQTNQNLPNLFSSYALFGVPAVVEKLEPARQPPPRKVTQANPKIQLDVKGILFGNNRYAIIRANGVEETYTTGEYISYLYIKEIGIDYVVFDDDGLEYKVYVLDGSSSVGGGSSSLPTSNNNQAASSQAASANSASQAAQSTAQNANQKAAKPATANTINQTVIGGQEVITPQLNSAQQAQFVGFKQAIKSNPLSMIGKINVVPYRSNGRITGFQVTPGAERALFAASGLQSGDIITSVNGQDLSAVNDFTKGMNFMNRLSNARDLDLMVLRGGQSKRIFLQLGN